MIQDLIDYRWLSSILCLLYFVNTEDRLVLFFMHLFSFEFNIYFLFFVLVTFNNCRKLCHLLLSPLLQFVCFSFIESESVKKYILFRPGIYITFQRLFYICIQTKLTCFILLSSILLTMIMIELSKSQFNWYWMA